MPVPGWSCPPARAAAVPRRLGSPSRPLSFRPRGLCRGFRPMPRQVPGRSYGHESRTASSSLESHVLPPPRCDANPANGKRAGVVYGPQCEIASKETGTAGRFYDEGRRGKWLAEIRPEAELCFKDDDWNRYRIIVQGNRYRSWVNGIAASNFTDDVDKSGFIGLQVHGIAKDQGPY
jgi:Domain of Unknown Function (DUF1080)